MKILGLFILSSLFQPHSLAQNGALFETLPISTNNRCHSIVFKGRHDYKQTAFVMPHVKIANDENDQPISQFVQINSNHYQYRFTLDFPRTIQQSQEERAQLFCDDDSLKEELKDFDITNISTLVIDNVEVIIDDLNNTKVLIADPDSTMVDLEGPKNVVFNIEGKEQLDKFKRLLQSRSGVEVDINFLMHIRKDDGKIKCSIDSKIFQRNIDITASGDAYISLEQLKIATQKTIKDSKAQCSIEASNSDRFDRVVDKVINRVTKQIAEVNRWSAKSPRTSNQGGSGGGNSGGSSGEGQPTQAEIEEVLRYCQENFPNDEIEECVCDRLPNHHQCDQSSNDTNNFTNENNGDNSTAAVNPKEEKILRLINECTQEVGRTKPTLIHQCVCRKDSTYPDCPNSKVSEMKNFDLKAFLSPINLEVSAVLAIINEKRSMEINISYTSTEAQEVYNTSFIIKQSGSNGEFDQISISNDLKSQKKIHQELHSGYEFEIIPIKEESEILKVEEAKTVTYNKDQLKDTITQEFFTQEHISPDGLVPCEKSIAGTIMFPPLSRTNIDKLKTKNNNAYLSIFKWSPSPWFIAGPMTFPYDLINSQLTYRWGHKEYTYSYQPNEEKEIEYKSLDNFKDLPIEIRFSEFPVHQFSLEDIINNQGDEWKVRYDPLAQSIKIIAKQDLGKMVLLLKSNSPTQSFYNTRHFVEGRSRKKTLRKCSPKDIEKELPINRKKFTLNYRVTPKFTRIDDFLTKIEIITSNNSILNTGGKNE